MRKPAVAAAFLAVAFALTACSAQGDADDSTMPESSQSQEAPAEDTSEGTTETALSGTFEGLNDKNVSGTVEVTADELVLSDFASDEGPDLHVYLTNGTDEAAVGAGVEIDVVAFDEASQTFSLEGIEVDDYTNVVIHCDAAAAVFGAAELS